MNNINKKEYEALLGNETHINALLANSTAYINEFVNDLNWVGYYLNEDNVLYLHTFQGKIACSKIPFDRGVCGYAAREQKVVVVDDVHQFKDHIACDANSKSEIVLPIMVNNKVFGVLDIDAPVVNRFDQKLVSDLTEFAEFISKQIQKIQKTS
ncbi:GAF domain-containing protein [Mycoplasma corogypsi]|uniref:GAF domain-containing protein n=1 Tax=Mycoplasma corogypsi TaxID=2106 RepID=UPI003872EFE4